jgi:CheY-like chemotaxis protein
MGGEIGAVSEERVGSEFWFTARLRIGTPDIRSGKPAESPAPPGPAPAEDSGINPGRFLESHPEAGSLRILVAEDNITDQHVALGILKKLGLWGDAVANGAKAIRLLEFVPYDLVLMDVQMPVMDGFEATATIRNPQSAVVNHDIPIIAMTARAMQGDREKCLEAGMSDYITKPLFEKRGEKPN